MAPRASRSLRAFLAAPCDGFLLCRGGRMQRSRMRTSGLAGAASGAAPAPPAGAAEGSSASFLSTMTMSSSSMSLGVVSLGAPTAGVDPEVTLAVVAVDRFLLLGDMNAMSLSRRPRERSAESCRAWLVLINVGYLLTYYWMADYDWQL